MTSAPPKSPSPQTDPPKDRLKPVKTLATFVFRLVLLGGSAGIAAALGIAIAHRFPAQVAEPPLLERMIRTVEQGMGVVRSRLPGAPPPTSASDAAGTDASPPATAASESVDLTAAERQLVQAELDQMRAEIQDLRDRTAQLEDRLAIPATSAPLEDRLRYLQQRLNPNADSGASFVAAPAVSIADATGDRTLQITLPSDALFEAEGSQLRPSARAILDSIALDLRAYPGSRVQVGAHTESEDAPAVQRELTFEQATAVERHLRSVLGDDYRWLSVGYGQTQPLTTDSTAVSRQRNRRIEITITPQ